MRYSREIFPIIGVSARWRFFPSYPIFEESISKNRDSIQAEENIPPETKIFFIFIGSFSRVIDDMRTSII